MRYSICLATLLALVATAAARASPTAMNDPAKAPVLTGPEATIPFVNHGAIYNFHAENDRGVWLQTSNRKWYYAQFFAPCIGIQFALSLGFRPGPVGTLDRWSSVVSQDTGRCSLTSLRPSEAPPGWAPKKARNQPQSAPADGVQTLPKDLAGSKVQ